MALYSSKYDINIAISTLSTPNEVLSAYNNNSNIPSTYTIIHTEFDTIP